MKSTKSTKNIMKAILALAIILPLVSTLASPRVESAILSASGDHATLTATTVTDGVTFTRSIEMPATSLAPDAQATLVTLLADLGSLLPAGFERGVVIVERTAQTLPPEWSEPDPETGEIELIATEQPLAAVAVYGTHAELGQAVLSTAAGTLAVTREQHAAILALLDAIEADLAGDSE